MKPRVYDLYPGQLVIQDVRTLHGSQLRDAAVIVGSSPCQEFSYRAMPWKRAKALPPPHLGMELFSAQFRVQREASEAAGRYIPLVVENVCGAQKWVGRAAWHFGSYYLWGDVPALMPSTELVKRPGRNFHFPEKFGIPSPSFHGADHEASVQRADAVKNSGGGWFGRSSNGKTTARNDPRDFRRDENGDWVNAPMGIKQHGSGHAWFDKALDDRRREAGAGLKNGGDWFGSGSDMSAQRRASSRSDSRKAASAMIAEIPYDLAQWIARTFKPAIESLPDRMQAGSSGPSPLLLRGSSEKPRVTGS